MSIFPLGNIYIATRLNIWGVHVCIMHYLKISWEYVYMWKTTETLAIQNTLAYQRQFLLYIKIFF